MAFSREVRAEILNRDKCCANCQRGEGFRLDASHYQHHAESYEDYNHPDNGRLLCKDCHLEDHLSVAEYGDFDYYSAVKLATDIYNHGYRTQDFNENHPNQLEDDRNSLIEKLCDEGFNPDDLINI